MRLNFRIPSGVEAQINGLLTDERRCVVGRRDGRGVLDIQRLDDGSSLVADEVRVELTPKGGRWMVVSDAWYFREGEAERWAPAKYAEFRVDKAGRALLVGLRSASLEPL